MVLLGVLGVLGLFHGDLLCLCLLETRRNLRRRFAFESPNLVGVPREVCSASFFFAGPRWSGTAGTRVKHLFDDLWVVLGLGKHYPLSLLPIEPHPRRTRPRCPIDYSVFGPDLRPSDRTHRASGPGAPRYPTTVLFLKLYRLLVRFLLLRLLPSLLLWCLCVSPGSLTLSPEGLPSPLESPEQQGSPRLL